MDTLVKDVAVVAEKLIDDSVSSVTILGHSMGGAVAAHVASRKLINKLSGLVVVDVVEGTGEVFMHMVGLLYILFYSF